MFKNLRTLIVLVTMVSLLSSARSTPPFSVEECGEYLWNNKTQALICLPEDTHYLGDYGQGVAVGATLAVISGFCLQVCIRGWKPLDYCCAGCIRTGRKSFNKFKQDSRIGKLAQTAWKFAKSGFQYYSQENSLEEIFGEISIVGSLKRNLLEINQLLLTDGWDRNALKIREGDFTEKFIGYSFTKKETPYEIRIRAFHNQENPYNPFSSFPVLSLLSSSNSELPVNYLADKPSAALHKEPLASYKIWRQQKCYWDNSKREFLLWKYIIQEINNPQVRSSLERTSNELLERAITDNEEILFYVKRNHNTFIFSSSKSHLPINLKLDIKKGKLK